MKDAAKDTAKDVPAKEAAAPAKGVKAAKTAEA
jgi:hypothetical protein